MTSVWAKGAGPAGQPRKQITFAEKIVDQKQKRNIQGIICTQIEKMSHERKMTKHGNLTINKIGTFLFDVLKIPLQTVQL